MTYGNDVGLLRGEAEPDFGTVQPMGLHHPDVARWSNLVRFFFGQVGYADEADYALMVMWGESAGRPDAVGPSVRLPSGGTTQARGLFQHMDHLWEGRIGAAAQFWQSRGVTISQDPEDPATSIAVAAWLRAVGGWGHWAATYKWYRPGTWTPQTYWDGYAYQNLGVPSTAIPPKGDGQVAGQEGMPARSSNASFIHPLPGYDVTGHFGDPRDGGARTHQGTDFGAPEGTFIRATAGGRVVSVGQGTDAAGLQITIDHGNGWSSFYCHISPGSFRVRAGQVVSAGDIIAEVGQTGNADGAHLHFQISYQGRGLDVENLGVTEQLNPDSPLPGAPVGGGGGSGGGTTSGRTFNRRDRLRAALLGTLDGISQSVAGGMRAPLPGSVPAWAVPTEQGVAGQLSPTREEVT